MYQSPPAQWLPTCRRSWRLVWRRNPSTPTSGEIFFYDKYFRIFIIIYLVRVCYDRTSHPEMLTEKEIESVTTVFRSFESGLRGATINPSVGFKSERRHLWLYPWWYEKVISTFSIPGSVQSAHNARIKSNRTRNGRYSQSNSQVGDFNSLLKSNFPYVKQEWFDLFSRLLYAMFGKIPPKWRGRRGILQECF